MGIHLDGNIMTSLQFNNELVIYGKTEKDYMIKIHFAINNQVSQAFHMVIEERVKENISNIIWNKYKFRIPEAISCHHSYSVICTIIENECAIHRFSL